MLDADGSGEVDFGELCAVCNAPPGSPEEATVRQLFDLLDLDHSGTVDCEELEKALKENSEARDLADQFDALHAFVVMFKVKKKSHKRKHSHHHHKKHAKTELSAVAAFSKGGKKHHKHKHHSLKSAVETVEAGARMSRRKSKGKQGRRGSRRRTNNRDDIEDLKSRMAQFKRRASKPHVNKADEGGGQQHSSMSGESPSITSGGHALRGSARKVMLMQRMTRHRTKNAGDDSDASQPRRSARSKAVARALSEEAEAFHQLEREEHAAQDKQAALIAKKKARHHSHHSQHSE